MKVRILPSLLAADMGHLEAEARRAEAAGGDALHLDIMDGHFVPNLSMGPSVVEMARRCVTIPLSVHLMLTNPEQYITRFAEAGADAILVHIEANCDVLQTIETIRNLGVKPGITLNPETPAEMVYSILGRVDEVLCMTVHPGYGGQAFMPSVLPKIRQLRDFAQSRGLSSLDILVDGGIGPENVNQCAAHGANSIIAGTSVFHARDMAQAISVMRQHAEESLRL